MNPNAQARTVPAARATAPPGRPNGNLTFEKYCTRMIARGSIAISGFSNVWNAKSIEMNVIAIPASVASSAALGVMRRRMSTQKAPANSIMPLPKQASRPTFHAIS